MNLMRSYFSFVRFGTTCHAVIRSCCSRGPYFILLYLLFDAVVAVTATVTVALASNDYNIYNDVYDSPFTTYSYRILVFLMDNIYWMMPK